MILRFTISALLLACASSYGQSTAELLQKGIYAQDTAGDLDGAIAAYRQIVSAPAGQRDVRAQAQYRLAQSLFKKGDLKSADTEATNLARQYPEQREQIAALTSQGITARRLLQVQTAPSRPAPPELATITGTRYHHIKSGTEFNIPAGWTVQGTFPSSDNGEQAMILDSVSKVQGQVWMLKETNTPAQVEFWLKNNIGMKIQMRHDSGYQDYWVRDSSIQQKYIGGRQAVSAMADFTDSTSKQKMVEYMTWINTENTRTFFFARGPASDEQTIQTRFDQIILSALVL